jgi:hypothetical protein
MALVKGKQGACARAQASLGLAPLGDVAERLKAAVC